MRKRFFCTAAVTLEILALMMSAATDQCAWGQADKPKETPVAELPMPDANGFINLFNGKDLTYWEGYPGYWSVKDDAITGSETSDKSLHTFLVLSASKADPAKFANFEIHFSYRWTEKGRGGNSGLQFRSKIVDEKTYKVGGYQADIDVNGRYDGGF